MFSGNRKNSSECECSLSSVLHTNYTQSCDLGLGQDSDLTWCCVSSLQRAGWKPSEASSRVPDRTDRIMSSEWKGKGESVHCSVNVIHLLMKLFQMKLTVIRSLPNEKSHWQICKTTVCLWALKCLFQSVWTLGTCTEHNLN